jgi:hypothetical protein
LRKLPEVLFGFRNLGEPKTVVSGAYVQLDFKEPDGCGVGAWNVLYLDCGCSTCNADDMVDSYVFCLPSAWCVGRVLKGTASRLRLSARMASLYTGLHTLRKPLLVLD